MRIEDKDLVDNPTPRVPVCLCLDTSWSMGDSDAASGVAPIEDLNRGVKLFFEAIEKHRVACHAAEIAVVTFGGEARKLLDFSRLSTIKVPSLTAHGYTPMGDAVSLSLDLLDSRKKKYRKNGVDYHQPWLVLMTDGKPEDGKPSHESEALSRAYEAATRTAALVEAKKPKLTVIPLALGPDADLDTLSRFSPKTAPLRIESLQFARFFEWLSQSVISVSKTNPSDGLDPDVDQFRVLSNNDY